MKKIFTLTTILLVVSIKLNSQVKVENFNIDGSNSIPNQYIIYEYDNLDETQLLKGIYLWVSKISKQTDITKLPSKKGLFIRESYDALPDGFLYQNDLGRRFAKPLDYFYEIAVKDNKVRLLLKDIRTSQEELKSSGTSNSYDDRNIPLTIDSSNLYLDVKLRDIKYAYSIRGVEKVLNLVNTKARSLKLFLDEYAKGNKFSDGSVVSQKVELFGFNADRNIFPFQYRVNKLDNELTALDVFNSLGEFNLQQSKLNEETFLPYFTHIDKENNYLVYKVYYRAASDDYLLNTSSLGISGTSTDYINFTFYYEKGELYVIMDNLLEAVSVYLGDGDAPKNFNGQSYNINKKVIYSYSSTEGFLKEFWNSSQIGIEDFNTSFFVQVNTLNKKGKERKSRMKNPILYSNYGNFINDELLKFFKSKTSSDENW